MSRKIFGFEEASRLFKYDPDTGQITRKVRTGTKTSVGQVCGTENSRCYLEVKVFRKNYKAHRLAWFLMTGAWPENSIDHINRNKSDNRWSNLRIADKTQQAGNIVYTTKSITGHRGVRKMENNFQARIGVKDPTTGVRKVKVIGTYKTMNEAIKAYTAAARAYYGEFYAGETRRHSGGSTR